MAFSGFSGSVIEAIIHLKDRQTNNPLEQFSATNKVSLEAIEGMAAQAFSGVEKLVELNLATTKSALGESFSYAHAALGAKDAPELMALQSDLLKPMADKAVVYMQHAPTIGTSSSVEFTKIIEVKTGEAQKAFGGVLENLIKNAPAGIEPAVAAFKHVLTAGQNAIETAQIQAKKAVEGAQTNVSAAARQTVDAVKKAAKVA